MIQSGNSNTIIENFIIDVSQSQKDIDIKLMSQFKTIIKFYKEQSQGKIQDPKMKKMLDMMDNKLDYFGEKLKTGNLEESSDDESVDEDEKK